MSHLNLPSALKVGAHLYSVEEWNPRDAGREGKYGEAVHSLRIIRVDTSYGYRAAAQTLLHELLHCVFVVWLVAESTEDRHERIVQTLEEGLAAVWRDNPGVMRWIHGGLAESQT